MMTIMSICQCLKFVHWLMPDLNDYQTNAMALNRGEDRFRALFPTYNREPLLGEKASCKMSRIHGLLSV
jgi:hypothetical protein